MLPLKSADAAHRFIRHKRLKSAYKLYISQNRLYIKHDVGAYEDGIYLMIMYCIHYQVLIQQIGSVDLFNASEILH